MFKLKPSKLNSAFAAHFDSFDSLRPKLVIDLQAQIGTKLKYNIGSYKDELVAPIESYLAMKPTQSAHQWTHDLVAEVNDLFEKGDHTNRSKSHFR